MADKTAAPARVASPPPTDAPPAIPSTVYDLIHTLFAVVKDAVDQPLSWEELKAPSVAYTVVKPLVTRFTPKPVKDDVPEDASHSFGAVLYAIMACRVQFLRIAKKDLSTEAVNVTRSDFCELLAIKILRSWPDSNDEVELTGELVRTWGALDGAPDDVRDTFDEDELERARDSAIELTIVSAAKRFLAQPLIQHLIDEIYSGHIVWHTQTTNSFIADNYVSPKTRRRRRQQRDSSRDDSAPSVPASGADDEYDPDAAEVYTYNPFLAGWLDYTRLRVPRWRSWIEFGSFALLLSLFVATLSTRNLHAVSGIEVIFVIYCLGFVLDEFAAARENGYLVYLANAWNMFDLAYLAIFFSYLALRCISLTHGSTKTADYAFDVLSLGACILFPRMVLFLINSNVVLIALRGMVATYINFMLLTAVAFSGIAFCLWELGHDHGKTMGHTAVLMFKIWFGTGNMNEAVEYHPTFGPPIFFVYNALCKTFLITMMMSMISQKYARVYTNAQQEWLYQRVVSTLEGVKSDSVFSYLPGFNIIALIVLVPLSHVASPKDLHSVNVFLIRACNFPVLFGISAYERWAYRTTHHRIRLVERGQISDKRGGNIFDSFFGSNADILIHAAFEVSPPAPAPATPPADPEAAGADLTTLVPVAKPKPTKEKTSALGKLFKGPAVGPVDGGATVTVSAEEWDNLRASQKRLEELLAKVAVVTGAAEN